MQSKKNIIGIFFAITLTVGCTGLPVTSEAPPPNAIPLTPEIVNSSGPSSPNTPSYPIPSPTSSDCANLLDKYSYSSVDSIKISPDNTKLFYNLKRNSKIIFDHSITHITSPDYIKSSYDFTDYTSSYWIADLTTNKKYILDIYSSVIYQEWIDSDHILLVYESDPTNPKITYQIISRNINTNEQKILYSQVTNNYRKSDFIKEGENLYFVDDSNLVKLNLSTGNVEKTETNTYQFVAYKDGKKLLKFSSTMHGSCSNGMCADWFTYSYLLFNMQDKTTKPIKDMTDIEGRPTLFGSNGFSPDGNKVGYSAYDSVNVIDLNSDKKIWTQKGLAGKWINDNLVLYQNSDSNIKEFIISDLSSNVPKLSLRIDSKDDYSDHIYLPSVNKLILSTDKTIYLIDLGSLSQKLVKTVSSGSLKIASGEDKKVVIAVWNADEKSKDNNIFYSLDVNSGSLKEIVKLPNL